MSLSEYVCYENKIRRPESLRTYLLKTTKEEWTERFEFVYKFSKEYIALSKRMSDTYVNYVIYNNKYLYTNDKETTSVIHSQLYSVYEEIRYKQFQMRFSIGKKFSERFPSIINPSYEIEHYLYCCELYASHRMKGIEYNLPFHVETDASLEDLPFHVETDEQASLEDFKLRFDESSDNDVSKKSEETWEGLKVVRTKTKADTLPILLTQDKEKTRKLEEMIKNLTVIKNTD
jgi:hypothetical protein